MVPAALSAGDDRHGDGFASSARRWTSSADRAARAARDDGERSRWRERRARASPTARRRSGRGRRHRSSSTESGSPARAEYSGERRSVRRRGATASRAHLCRRRSISTDRPGRVTGADVLLVPAAQQGGVDLGGGRRARGRRDRTASTARRRTASASSPTRGRGIGTEIVERGEAFAARRAMKKILAGAAEPDAARARALRVARLPRGAALLRDGDRAGRRAVGARPAGWARRGRVARRRVRAFYDALNEAFAEHWEWRSPAVRRVARASAGPASRRRRPHLVRRPRRRRARCRHA